MILADYRSDLPLASFDSATTRSLDAEAIEAVLAELVAAQAEAAVLQVALEQVCHDCLDGTSLNAEHYLLRARLTLRPLADLGRC